MLSFSGAPNRLELILQRLPVRIGDHRRHGDNQRENGDSESHDRFGVIFDSDRGGDGNADRYPNYRDEAEETRIAHGASMAQ